MEQRRHNPKGWNSCYSLLGGDYIRTYETKYEDGAWVELDGSGVEVFDDDTKILGWIPFPDAETVVFAMMLATHVQALKREKEELEKK